MADEKIVKEYVLTYEDVAPLISKHLTLDEIPVEGKQLEIVVPEVTKEKIMIVLNSKLPSSTERAIEAGLTKAQVIKIQKEFAAAKSFKGGQ